MIFIAAGLGSARAVPTLTFFDGVNTVTVVDNGVGDINLTLGNIVVSGSLGSGGIWSGNASGSVGGQPALGLPVFTLNSLDISTSAGGTLTITLTDGTYHSNFGSVATTIFGGVSSNGTILYQTFANNTLLTSIGLITGTPFNLSTTGVLPSDPTYTLKQQVTITHTGAGTTSFEAILAVPDAGATCMLLGSALMGMSFLRRRKAASIS